MDANGFWYGLAGSPRVSSTSASLPQHQPGHKQEGVTRQPRVIIIGAGSRGNAYARAMKESGYAIIQAVAEPDEYKRARFGSQYVWSQAEPQTGQSFVDWRDFKTYELRRRGSQNSVGSTSSEAGVDAAFVCTLDHQHAEIVVELTSLGLHIMCEKPLATTLADCLKIYTALQTEALESPRLFSIGHVLRYSPHNAILRQILLQDKAIGDIISIEHTEPVGWWHFAHSYVRGNWRREDVSAPSLLTKSCHDIDLILWLLASPTDSESDETAHWPTNVSSTGQLNLYRKRRKPTTAGQATNCIKCPIEPDCRYSAKKIYLQRHLGNGNTGWPVKIVNPEIESCYSTFGIDAAESKLLQTLTEDYDNETPDDLVKSRPWFGRCVWESDNDVCDDQVVTMTWEDDADGRRHGKTATFHMIAHTEAQCERRGIVYGTEGEIMYDSKTIKIHKFATGCTEVLQPKQMGGGHGGGDAGLVDAFIRAVDAVINNQLEVTTAQRRFIGCTIEDVLRSHAMVFAAEQARTKSEIVDWRQWWHREVECKIESKRRGESLTA